MSSTELQQATPYSRDVAGRTNTCNHCGGVMTMVSPSEYRFVICGTPEQRARIVNSDEVILKHHRFYQCANLEDWFAQKILKHTPTAIVYIHDMDDYMDHLSLLYEAHVRVGWGRCQAVG